MKNKLITILAILLITGCGLYKKTSKSTTSTQTTEKTKVATKDSTSVIKTSQPTESQITLDIESLSQMIGDFTQRITSGDGNESVIEKRGGQLTVRNNNAGSTKEQTKVKEDTKETEFNSEYWFQESRKVVSRLPWWFWAIGIMVLIIWLRKFIAQILLVFFPGAVLLKIFSGVKP